MPRTKSSRGSSTKNPPPTAPPIKIDLSKRQVNAFYKEMKSDDPNSHLLYIFQSQGEQDKGTFPKMCTHYIENLLGTILDDVNDTSFYLQKIVTKWMANRLRVVKDTIDPATGKRVEIDSVPPRIAAQVAEITAQMNANTAGLFFFPTFSTYVVDWDTIDPVMSEEDPDLPKYVIYMRSNALRPKVEEMNKNTISKEKYVALKAMITHPVSTTQPSYANIPVPSEDGDKKTTEESPAPVTPKDHPIAHVPCNRNLFVDPLLTYILWARARAEATVASLHYREQLEKVDSHKPLASLDHSIATVEYVPFALPWTIPNYLAVDTLTAMWLDPKYVKDVRWYVNEQRPWFIEYFSVRVPNDCYAEYMQRIQRAEGPFVEAMAAYASSKLPGTKFKVVKN